MKQDVMPQRSGGYRVDIILQGIDSGSMVGTLPGTTREATPHEQTKKNTIKSHYTAII